MDNFFQFTTSQSSNPLEDLRALCAKWQLEARYDLGRKNVEDFLNLTDKEIQEGSIEYIYKTNVGAEGAGTDSVLMIATPAIPREKQDNAIKTFLISRLYESGDGQISKCYFMPSYIPYVYVWWEEGTKEVNDMGTFVNDNLRGFIKVSKVDFDKAHK